MHGGVAGGGSKKVGSFWEVEQTDSSREGRRSIFGAILDCLLIVIRALRMGSCLSLEGEVSRSFSSLQASGESGKARGRSKEEEEQLREVPGRMCLNGSSSVASLFTQRGKKGTNQDAMIVWEVCSFLEFHYLVIW